MFWAQNYFCVLFCSVFCRTEQNITVLEHVFCVLSSLCHIRYVNNHISLTKTYLGWSQNVLWFGSFPRLFIIIVLPRFIQKTVLKIWISLIFKSWLTIFKNPDFKFVMQFQTKRKWFWVQVELFDSPATWYNWAAKNNRISSNPNPKPPPESILEQ